VTEDGSPIGVRRAGENWHSDMCYASRPPRGTMLYALEIPELFGLILGDTEFASAAAAWDALPERVRRHLDGRRAVFDFAGRKRAFPPSQADQASLHPSPPMAGRGPLNVGQLHGAAPGDPGLRLAATPADAPNDHGRRGSDVGMRR
jgi:hypothetical protein